MGGRWMIYLYTWIPLNLLFFPQTFSNSSLCCYNYEEKLERETGTQPSVILAIST